jgi:hypothetical protein
VPKTFQVYSLSATLNQKDSIFTLGCFRQLEVVKDGIFGYEGIQRFGLKTFVDHLSEMLSESESILI